jgi:hypothetical protein
MRYKECGKITQSNTIERRISHSKVFVLNLSHDTEQMESFYSLN